MLMDLSMLSPTSPLPVLGGAKVGLIALVDWKTHPIGEAIDKECGAWA